MPRLNLYEQQTTAQGPRASGADFGAAPAQALEGAGNVLQEIGDRVQRREELGAAQNVMEDVDTWAVSALDDFQKRQDIMGQQALPEFQNALNQKRQEALSNFTGRPEAKAALERQLDNQLAQYGKSAITAKIKAGQDQMGRALNQQFDKSSIQVDAAPDIWSFAKDENLAAVEMWKPAMTRDQYESAKRLAYAKPLQAAVRSHLAQGNIEGAEALMKDEAFGKYLTADEARPLIIDSAVEKGKRATEVKRIEAKIAQYRLRLGRELTPDEVSRIRTLPAKKDMTPADEITELELIQQKPASQDQVDKIFKTYIDDGAKGGSFGNSLQGRSLSYVTENSVAYANGHLTPAQARQFEASFNEAYAPKDVLDPVTGQMRRITPSVPGFAQEAMTRGSSIYRGGMASGPRPGETVQLDINGQTMGTGVVDANGKWAIPAPPESSSWGGENRGAGQPAPAAAAPAGGGASLWEQASNVAGPVAGVQRWIGSGPVPMGIGGEQVGAAQQVEMQQRNLVRALQQNPRYAEGERKSIEKDIQISPEAMSNPTAYRLRLVEIGRYIQEELQFQSSILKNPNGSTVQQRQQALQSTSVLNDFYGKLGLPQQVKSIEEAKKLPPGTQFLDENWILRQVPGSR